MQGLRTLVLFELGPIDFELGGIYAAVCQFLELVGQLGFDLPLDVGFRDREIVGLD